MPTLQNELSLLNRKIVGRFNIHALITINKKI